MRKQRCQCKGSEEFPNYSQAPEDNSVFGKTERPVQRGGVGDRTILATTPALYSTESRVPTLSDIAHQVN
jgi:hypothetical protein